MKIMIFYTLTLFLVSWVQMASDYFLGITGLSPNIVLIVVLYFGLVRGPMGGVLLGFFWGMMMDASSLGVMGLHALLYSGAGYLAGMLRRQLDEKKAWTQSIFSLGISFIYRVLYFVLDRIFSTGPHPLSWSVAVEPLLNAAMAPVFFWLMDAWCQLWDVRPVED